MQQLTEHGRRIVDDLARRHGVTPDAVLTLLLALMEGRGTQAQFNHPHLGGMGQWSQGGMIMIGDMFNTALKARVDALATELAAALRGGALLKPAEPGEMSSSSSSSQSQSQSQGAGGGDVVSLFAAQSLSHWWPADLGQPAATGAQNSMRYAFFPGTRRLAIDLGGTVTVYDTGDHRIGGFSQQQGGGQSATFTSQHGLVRLADLPVVPRAKASGGGRAEKPADPTPDSQAGDIFTKIERLAELRDKGVISEKEFEAKKTELLSRI